jgi:DNA invertase Pin-like site-specific DNA recombinase
MSESPSPRIYSYVRFSSERQLKGDSLRRQNELIDKYTKEKGYKLDSEFRYVDVGISAFKGRNLKEGKLRHFIEAIREKKVPEGSILLIESLDRLTRLEPLEALTVFLEIINAGVTIVTLIDGIEHSKDQPPERRMINLIISTTSLCRAHDESSTKSTRLKKAWEQKRRDIKLKYYTSRVPCWLSLPKGAIKPIVDPAKTEIVKKIFELCLAGNHAEGIARRFHRDGVPILGKGKAWTFSFVAQILRNPAVTGEFTPNRMENGKRVSAGTTISGYYPEIISKDEFNRVQFIMDSRSRCKRGGRVSPKAGSLFRKVLFCGYCGAPVYRTAKGRFYKGTLRRTLLCRNAKEGTGCFYVGWEYDEFEKSFLAAATELRHAMKDKFDGRPIREELQSLAGEEADLSKRMEKQLNISDVADQSGENAPKELLNRIKTLSKQLEEVRRAKADNEKKLAAGMEGTTPLLELEELLKKLEDEKIRLVVSDLIGQIFQRIDLFPAGSKFQLAKLKSMHGQLLRERGKPDGYVNARLRERFNRRKVRFFQAVLNLPGVNRRLIFADNGRLLPEARLDLVEDLPEETEIVTEP